MSAFGAKRTSPRMPRRYFRVLNFFSPASNAKALAGNHKTEPASRFKSSNQNKPSAAIVAPGVCGGRGNGLALRSLIIINSAGHPAVFFREQIMEAEKHYRGPRLPAVCAECEDELGLSRSGHQFCTNRLCKDGFDVRPDWRFMPLPNIVTKRKSDKAFSARSIKKPNLGRPTQDGHRDDDREADSEAWLDRFFLIPITHKFVAAIPLWIVGWLASS